MPDAYDRYTKAFHWILALLIAAEYVFVWLIPDGTRGPNALASWHMSFGILILVLMAARLVWRLYTTFPPQPAGTPQWQVLASTATHYALYALLVIMPLSGWLWVSAHGWSVTLFGLMPLPELIAQQDSLATTLGHVHEFLGSVILALVGVHVVGALYHWIIVKDRVMQRMWP